MNIVKCVIGANFGDESKGLMTDYFASQNPNTLVVLHNGGAQRGHTVVTPNGIRYVFHHFGAGTLANAATYFASEFIVNPIIFRREMTELNNLGIKFKVYINPNCRMTTIYDMLLNQVIEQDRGRAKKHGSCGMGIFETLYRNQSGIKFKDKFIFNKLAMTVGQFNALSTLDKIDFLDHVRLDYVRKRFDAFGLHNIDPIYIKTLTEPIVIGNFLDDFEFMMNNSTLRDDEILNDYDQVIFESGQGLLLDQDNMDYYPHLTPSNTGFKNPADILIGLGYKGEVEVCYVSRTYMTRHGVGRFDTECPKEQINAAMLDITNVPNPFQDTLRYGTIDMKEMQNRCIEDANKYAAGLLNIKPTWAITHVNEYFEPCGGATYLSDGLTRDSVSKLYDIKEVLNDITDAINLIGV